MMYCDLPKCKTLLRPPQFFFSMVLFFFSLGVFSQGSDKQALERVRDFIVNTRFDAATSLCDSLIQYSADSTTKGKAYNSLGVIHQELEQYPEAIDYYTAAIDHYPVSKRDTLAAGPYYNLGRLYKDIGQADESAANLYKAVALFDSTDNKVNLARVYNLLGILHRDEDDYDRSIKYHQRALSIREELLDTAKIAGSINNIGSVYLEMEYLDMAIEHFQQAMALKNGLGAKDQQLIASTLFNLGKAFRLVRAFDLASENLRKSLSIRKEIGERRDAAYCYNELGKLQIELGNYVHAHTYLDSALAIGGRVNDRNMLYENYAFRAEVYEAQGSWREASIWTTKLLVLHKQIVSAEKQKMIENLDAYHRVGELRTSFEKLAQENELGRLKIESEKSRAEFWLYVTVGSLLVIFLLSLLLYERNKAYEDKKRYTARIEKLSNETHHRVKNNLQKLLGLIEIQIRGRTDASSKEAFKETRNRIAAMLLIHQSLSGKISEDHVGISMPTYLQSLTQNLLLVYGLSDSVDVVEDLKPLDLDDAKALTVGLIVNEMICNALKYGMGAEHPVLTIKTKTERGQATITITDNGAGFDPKTIVRGTGTNLIDSLLKEIDATWELDVSSGVSYIFRFRH